MSEKLIPYFRDEPSKRIDDVEFHAWFNRTSSVEQSIKSGFVDFAHKIFTPDFYQILGNPADKKCCEIGFGGGRLLLPAACFFDHAHGIDIHSEFDRVCSHMTQNGRHNFSLHSQEDILNNSILNSSIDFFYSFITFQHFPNWNVAQSYFTLIKRTLKVGGCGIIYFGNNVFSDRDIHLESPKLYDDFPMILHVKREFAIKELKQFGLTPFEDGMTTKTPWSSSMSRQFYVKFKKENDE